MSLSMVAPTFGSLIALDSIYFNFFYTVIVVFINYICILVVKLWCVIELCARS